jgi:poly-gamma-glutamate capsule biosynthesis protein CapA/YwtB (metallophosphatase superfamily)
MENLSMPINEKPIHLLAAGDLLIHDAVIQSAHNPSDDSYDFKPMFCYISGIVHNADIAICNLETTISGKQLGYRGYPEFNAPEEILDAAKACGFTVISTANNHSVDYGEIGIRATLEAIRKRALHAIGTSDSPDPDTRNLILDSGNLKIGFNSYTYGTNEHYVPADKPWLINMIDFDLIKTDIDNMRSRGADLIALSLHAGEEYLTMPDKDQVSYVKKMRDLGADLILGSHPHIVQPAIQDPEGNFFVIYSIGNFLSNQREALRDTGVLIDIALQKKGNRCTIDAVTFHPTYVHRWEDQGKFHYRIVPLDRYQEIGKELPDFPFEKAEAMRCHVLAHIRKKVD